MSLTAVFVRSITFLSSLLLIALSITALYTSIDGTNRLETDFPTSWYGIFYGPVNADRETNKTAESQFLEKFVHISYDGSVEYTLWAAAAFGLAVGLLSIVVEAMRLWRLRGSGKGSNAAGPSKVTSIATIVFPAISFIISLIATIYAKVHTQKVADATCDLEAGALTQYMIPKPGRDSYTCTRELAACSIINWFNEPLLAGARETTCVELKISRITLIPMTVFSALLVAEYGVQMWLAGREKSVNADADERVRRLQKEEEE